MRTTRAMARVLLALLCTALMIAASARPGEAASAGAIHPDVREATAEVEASRGRLRAPRAYAALRRLWATWADAPPMQVEAALRQAAADPRLSGPARAYATVLGAIARRRRGDVATARRELQDLGYVTRWQVLGPFDNEGRGGLASAQGPETDWVHTRVPGHGFQGKERLVRWRVVPNVFPDGVIDVGGLLRPRQKTCAFISTFVTPQQGAAGKTILAWVGATGAFKLFWNGVEVAQDTAYRAHDHDRVAAAVKLPAGTSDLTLKVCGDVVAPAASIRLSTTDGLTAAPVTTSNTTAAGTRSRPSVEAAKKKAPRPPRRRLDGPLQAFAKLASRRAPRADDQFAFAEYLVTTGGDDATTHQARNLARRAAESKPTVERLLQVSRLAEDRNRQREWIDKALALKSTDPDDRLAVLIAQARHARGSANWRSALPYYDEALRLDRDSLDAIRGRVELLNEAGLGRTALATIEAAVRRQPHSVTRLNMLATQLRKLGRTTEAGEVEGRYQARRFSDRALLSQRLEMAVRRRNEVAARHWIARLRKLDPASQWALLTAAKAYRRLGKPRLALAAYQEARALAPEDVANLKALAALHGELGERQRQLDLLREVLKLRPQDRFVREYVEHARPPKARKDETLAWDARRFLHLRNAPARGQAQRVLRDLTVTTVYDNGLSSRFRQIVFQPLTEAAAAAASQYVFGYQADRQMVRLRGAKVYRANGKVDEAIEFGEGAANNPAISMYTSARTFYVQFPRLERGDVVDLRYRIDDTSTTNVFNDYFGDVAYLQSDEPKQNVEYVLVTPTSRKFYVDSTVTGLKRTTKVDGKQRIQRFFAAKVDPLVVEPAMPAYGEVAGFLHVSTYKSYDDVGKWYWGLVKDQFDLDDETRKLARTIGGKATTTRDKVEAVYSWVIKNTRYVALEFGIYGYKPRRCVQTVARGWGDCKDKATVIVSLLKELGVKATIVIVRTQLRGDFNSKVASLAPFDHAIAYVPELDLYLDGTAEYTGVNELPAMDEGALALLVNQGQPKLVHLPVGTPAQNVVKRAVTFDLKADGSGTLAAEYEVIGATAPSWRRRYHAESTRRERVQNDLGSQFPGFELAPGSRGLTAGDMTDFDTPVRLTARGKAPELAQKEGTDLTVRVTTRERLTPRFGALSKRVHPVRILGFSGVADRFEVKLPAGAKVRSLPKTDKADNKFGYYSVTAREAGGKVIVESRLGLKVTKVSPADYPAFRRFCQNADRALSRPLVIRP